MKANRLLVLCMGILIVINVFLLFERNKPEHVHPHHHPKLSVALDMKGLDAKWVDREFHSHIKEKGRFLEQQKAWRMKLLLDRSKKEQNHRIFEIFN